jgi:hypothetical protein
MWPAIRILGLVAVVAIVAAACGSSAAPSVSPSASAQATPFSTATAASALPSSAPSAATAKRLTARCSDLSPCNLTAGTWITSGDNVFIPGLAFTVPEGWSSHQSDIGELKLIPLDRPDDAIFFWKDVVAIESNGGTPKVLTGVPGTPEGLTTSFQKNPDFVVSKPTSTTIAGALPAVTYMLGVSPKASYSSHECPSYPACANILKDPVHWRSDFYAIGSPEVIQLYLATVGADTDRHTFVISLDAPNAVELKHLTDAAAPIIASIRLPALIGSQ